MPPLAPTTTAAGKYLRELRLSLGYETQGEFADELDVTQATVSRVEKGTRPLSRDLAFRLVTRVGADPTEVARYAGNPGLLNLMRYPEPDDRRDRLRPLIPHTSAPRTTPARSVAVA